MKIKIGNLTFDVIVAQTEEEKEIGLQNVEEMDSDEGMLFDYSNDPQEDLSFWMVDTDIPLDVIFIGIENTVLSVHKGMPQSEEYMTEPGPVKYVLEVNQNSGINVGDVFTIGEESEESEDVVEENLETTSMQVIGSDGQVQMEIEGGERIFSIPNTKKLVALAKKAYASQSDEDYKKLGKAVFEFLYTQDNNEPDYVETED